MCIASIFEVILYGLLSGAITALLGYAKSVGEKFDGFKAFYTLVIGAIVGAVGGYFGMDYYSAYDWLMSIGAITVIQYAIKAIWRRIHKT